MSAHQPRARGTFMATAVFAVAAAFATLATLAALPPRAHAQEPAPDDPHAGDAARDALPGLVRLGLPVPLAPGFALTAAGSYGYTESVLGDDDTHHRGGITLAVSYRPRPSLAVALRIDGRHDAHSGSLDGADDGWIGDSRLELRYVMPRLTPRLGLGGAVTLWFPGERPLVPEPDAISLDLEGWAAWRLSRRVQLVGGAGLRLDRSAASVSNAARLSRADRLALGVGDEPAVLLGVGGFWTRGTLVVFGEWTWDLLVGADALPARESPMRLDAGVRFRVAGGATLQVSAEVGLSQRPELMAGVPLAPFEPRVTLLAGMSWSFGARGRAAVARGDAEVADVARPPAPQVVRGRLLTPAGEPLAGVRVRLGDREATTDADGWFTIADVAPGETRLEIDAPPPWSHITTAVTVGAAPLALGDLRVERELPPGQVRGAVRSAAGKPLAAEVTLLPLGTKVETAADGSFRVDVPPGAYQVVIEARGFAPQRRQIVVDENGVTVLNVELRPARGGAAP